MRLRHLLSVAPLAVVGLVAAVLTGPAQVAVPGLDLPPVAASTAAGDSGLVAGGDQYFCSLTGTGGVKCWGKNTFGELGDGTTTDRWAPVPVIGLGANATAVTTGHDHTCVLTEAGGVKCWGNNISGQLGDGTTTDRSAPVEVVGLSSGVTAIAAGNFHTCAVTGTGGVKCWGRNNSGQLGDGSSVNRSTPVDVIGLTADVTAIAPGANHTCLLTDSGGVKCWGYNPRGGVGDGTTINRSTPVDVVGLGPGSGVTAISAYGNLGGSRACAVTSVGGLKCWGDNTSAQLGDGTTTDRLVPVDVVGLSSGVVSVTTGATETCAVTAAGGVKCWGKFGIGDGVYSADLRTIPVDVVGLATGVDEIDAGSYAVCALKSSGGVACWGGNLRGALGQGLTGAEAQVGRVPRDVSGSFFRDECPTLVLEPHSDYSMTDGYGVGSVVSYTADPGYALDGPATLTCEGDLAWDDAPPTVVTAVSVVVVPDTGLDGGDIVEVQLGGFAPLADIGWAQCIVIDPPSPDNCAGIGLGQADETGALTIPYRVQRFFYAGAAGRWIDCADQADTCVIAAADTTDIAASAAWTEIGFAPPPPPPTPRGTITLTPSEIVTPGELVTVTGSGFRPDTSIDVFQCAADPDHPDDCNLAAASATTDASGGFTLDVTVVGTVQPPGGSPTDCFSVAAACSIAAAETVDFPGTVVALPIAPRPVVIPGGAITLEGDGGTQVMDVPVRLSHPFAAAVTVEWSTLYQPTWSEIAAVPGVDYQAAADTVTFAPGQTSQTVPVTIEGDMVVEPHELLVVSFRRPTNAQIGGYFGLGFGAIANDDDPP